MRLRLRFAKHGKVRFTSHRDVARMWERAFRRVALPVSYTGGFRPRPKISFGLALPTGCESEAEYLDLEVEEEPQLEFDDLCACLTEALPVGIEATAAVALGGDVASLQEAVTACTWEIEAVGVDEDRLRRLVASTLGAETLVVHRERKGRDVVDDVRPAIETLEASHPTDDGVALCAVLRTQPRGLRPAELLAVLGGIEARRVRRLHQWIERDGARIEPEAEGLPLAATRAPHAEARAS